MTRSLLILSSLMFFVFSTAVALEKLTQQKIDNIKAILELSNYKETVRVTWENMFQQIIKVQQAAKPELNNPTYEKVLMDVGRMLVEEMVDENSSYMASVIHTYHRHFTANEIRQMLEWQASPVGKKSSPSHLHSILAVPVVAHESRSPFIPSAAISCHFLPLDTSRLSE